MSIPIAIADRRILGALALVALVASSVFTADEITNTQEQPPRSRRGTAFQRPKVQVEQGTQVGAETYYKDVVSSQLELLTPTTILASGLKELLTYFGYTDLSPSDLHRLNSKELMEKAPGDVLASRFFAPKVTDVTDKTVVDPAGGYGWRKLCRLKAKAGSKAAEKGLESMYLLQNTFTPDVQSNPYDPTKFVSKNNQVIVVRSGVGPFSGNSRAAYFLLYGNLVALDPGDKTKPKVDAAGKFTDEGKLITSLAATFDEDDRDPETNSKPKAYFAPDACVQCHGAISNRGKLNLLDTDHWFDRVTPQYGIDAAASEWFKEEDFTALATSPWSVLYDGGKDPSTAQFSEAFAVIRKLNDEVKNQNQNAGGNGPANFQLRAAEKWMNLHQADTNYVPPYKRGFGQNVWQEDNQTHRKALYFLNRYCYRCHSSVRFNVFDLQAVKQQVGSIKARVQELEDASNWMPQDRIFPGLTKDPITGDPVPKNQLKEFLELLGQL